MPRESYRANDIGYALCYMRRRAQKAAMRVVSAPTAPVTLVPPLTPTAATAGDFDLNLSDG